MQHDLETLRKVLWDQFEQVAARQTLKLGEEYSKAQALGALAGPLLAVELQLKQKQPITAPTAWRDAREGNQADL